MTGIDDDGAREVGAGDTIASSRCGTAAATGVAALSERDTRTLFRDMYVVVAVVVAGESPSNNSEPY